MKCSFCLSNRLLRFMSAASATYFQITIEDKLPVLISYLLLLKTLQDSSKNQQMCFRLIKVFQTCLKLSTLTIDGFRSAKTRKNSFRQRFLQILNVFVNLLKTLHGRLKHIFQACLKTIRPVLARLKVLRKLKSPSQVLISNECGRALKIV